MASLYCGWEWEEQSDTASVSSCGVFVQTEGSSVCWDLTTEQTKQTFNDHWSSNMNKRKMWEGNETQAASVIGGKLEEC